MSRMHVVAVTLAVLAACLTTAAAQTAGPAEGGPLPKIVLPAPKDPDQVAYLGLGSRKEFTVDDIPAQVVIIQIFNMY